MLSNSRTGTHNIFIFSLTRCWQSPGQISLCAREETNKISDRPPGPVFMSRKGHRVSLWSMPGGCWLPWSRKPTEEMTVPSVISITVQMYTQCTPHRSLQDILNRGLFPSLYSKLYNSSFSKRCT